MTNPIDTKVINGFIDKTDYPLDQYLAQFILFMTNDYPKLISYYKGIVNQTDNSVFNNLHKLINASNEITKIIKTNANAFTNFQDWELTDYLDEIKVKLVTFLNSDKWLRSSKDKNSYFRSYQYNFILGEQQTLERVSLNQGSTDSQNDWEDIALKNDLEEIEYSAKGGNSLVLQTNKVAATNIFVNSIVDRILGETIYGIDLDKKLQFDVDAGDLKVLNYRDTVEQDVLILVQIKKGDVPEFPDFGVDTSLSVGSDIGALLYSSVIRQLNANFDSDDSLVNFSVKSLNYSNGDLKIDFSVETRYDLIYNATITV